jgi:prepilin-type N-terminal cleavage/methylation domain-containing protein
MKKGFSLIEILIGAALFAIVFSTAGVVIFSTLRGSRKTIAVTTAKSEGEYALSVMTDDIKFADKVTCDATGMKLQVDKSSSDRLVYSFDSSVSPDKIKWVSGTLVSPGPITADLTSEKIVVTIPAADCTGVMFVCDAAQNAVKICFAAGNASGTDTSDLVNSVNGIVFKTSVTLINSAN